jgi:hypothetical protein
VKGFIASKQNPEVNNIIMVSEDGSKTFFVYSAGNVKYLIADGRVKANLLTKIVRLADKNVKGKNSSQFDVLQDSTRTLEAGATSEGADRQSISARAADLASKASRPMPASATRQ